MIHFVLIIGLFLLAVAVTMVVRALSTPGGRSTETHRADRRLRLRGHAPAPADARSQLEPPGATGRPHRRASAGGSAAASRASRGPTTGRGSISAGMYTTTPERLLGTQFLVRGRRSLPLALARGSRGIPAWFVIFGYRWPPSSSAGCPRCSSSTARRGSAASRSSEDLPDLIDLLVVTLEAGLSFPQSLRLAATKIKEPLASEVRLTLQEQNMGLTLVEALENFLGRIDTPACACSPARSRRARRWVSRPARSCGTSRSSSGSGGGPTPRSGRRRRR